MRRVFDREIFDTVFFGNLQRCAGRKKYKYECANYQISIKPLSATL